MTRGRWSAPGRVNLIGEHVDYNRGPVLPIAIDARTRVDIAIRPDDRVRVRSTMTGEDDAPVEFGLDTEPGEVSGWAAYVAGAIWALRGAGVRPPGMEIEVDSDVPRGAGLSSSAALECAVALAVRDLAGVGADEVDDIALALLAQQAENDYVGMPCGAMDQLASMCGRPDHALLIDTAGPAIELVPAYWSDDGLALLVIDTHAAHELTGSGYADRRRSCELAAEQLGLEALALATPDDVGRLDDDLLRRRTRHIVTEVARVHEVADAMASHDWEAVGRTFSASHVSMRDDFEISCAELDVAVVAAERSGALGARMTGGGFGGSAIALVPRDQLEQVESACRSAFAESDFDPPSFFVATPAQGALRADDPPEG